MGDQSALRLYRVWLSHPLGGIHEAVRLAAYSATKAHDAALREIRRRATIEDPMLDLGLDLSPELWHVEKVEEIPSLVREFPR